MGSITTLVYVLCFIRSALGGYGDDYGGYPSYQERALHALTNAIRSAPRAYITSDFTSNFTQNMTGILNLNDYPARSPLYWTYGLNQAATTYSRFLSFDTCYQSGFCNGTDTGSRIRISSNCTNTYGELIGMGNAGPLPILNSWLCGTPTGACALDNDTINRASRDIITDRANNGFTSVGSGYYFKSGSNWTWYWTQDYSKEMCVNVTNKIYSGIHIDINNRTRFIVSFYDSAPPTEAYIVLKGTAKSLDLLFGTPAAGTYYYESKIGGICRDYFFYFVDSTGNSWYYPETGSIYTYGEGNCGKIFLASQENFTISTTSTSATTSTTSVSTDGSSGPTGIIFTTGSSTTDIGTTGPISTTGTTWHVITGSLNYTSQESGKIGGLSVTSVGGVIGGISAFIAIVTVILFILRQRSLDNFQAQMVNSSSGLRSDQTTANFYSETSNIQSQDRRSNV